MKAEVKLEGLDFYAYHGFYVQEQQIGNHFSVDVVVHFEYTQSLEKEELTQTVDYSALCEFVQEEMIVTTKLLETLAERIIDRIFILDSSITHVEVSVSKYNPPIGGRCERARVTLKKDRA